MQYSIVTPAERTQSCVQEIVIIGRERELVPMCCSCLGASHAISVHTPSRETFPHLQCNLSTAVWKWLTKPGEQCSSQSPSEVPLTSCAISHVLFPMCCFPCAISLATVKATACDSLTHTRDSKCSVLVCECGNQYTTHVMEHTQL